MESVNNIHVKFHHVVLRGSAEMIGRQQGEMIRPVPGAVEYFGSGPVIPASAPVDKTIRLMETYCPGLVDELTGFSEAAGFPLEKLVYLSMTHIGGTYCSHFAVRPAVTTTGHTLIGRNYDFGHKVDDLKLTTVFPEGRYASMGFPTLFFGRNDGLNEKGLSITMSVGGMPVGIMPGQRPPLQEGLQFWALVRTLLDTCKNVEEAEACFTEFPCSGNPIIIAADSNGNISRMEALGPHKTIKRAESATPFMAATNHYQSVELAQIDSTCMANSDVRLQAIHRFVQENSGKMTPEKIKDFLGTPYPAGLCTHFYSEFFGTLHSCVFDLEDRSAEITFGSPAVNEWRRFDFKNPQPGEFDVVLPDEHSTREFWAAEKK